MTGVYLLHFEQPISDQHTTQHYMGWATDIESRISQHEKGLGARLTEVAKERGIKFVVARIWKHACRDTERRLKNRKEGPRLCPICNPKLSVVEKILI